MKSAVAPVRPRPSLSRAAAKITAAPVANGRKDKPAAGGPLAQMIPVAQIERSKHNPRKRFDEAKLKELQVSIEANGVLQPILVRKTGFPGLNGHKHGFELVAGERRWRAAKAAGLATIPAIVRELTDEQVLEIQVIENDQREDVTPMERASGYQRLVEKHGVKVEDLAKRIGKSASTIRGLLKLLLLPPSAKEAVEEGWLPVSTAELLGRVPGEKSRSEATYRVLCNDRWANRLTAEDLREAKQERGPLSFRETKAMIEERFMVELKSASFSRVALDLVKEAGSCDACPKRTGNNPDWAGSRADVCTDPECFAAKTTAHAEKAKKAWADKGQKVLSAAEAKQAFHGSHISYSGPYAEATDRCYDDRKQRTWGELCGKDLQSFLAIGIDEAGGLHHVVAKKDFPAIMKARGIKARAGLNTSLSRNDKAIREKAAAGKKAADAAQALIAAKAQREMALLLGGQGAGSAVGNILLAIATGIADHSWHDACHRICKRRKIDETKGGGTGAAIVKHANGLQTAAELFGLIAELVAARVLLDWGSPYGGEPVESKRWVESLGVNATKLLQEAKAAKKAAAV
jgi:ParB/RepB/Spo0J family partition protein